MTRQATDRKKIFANLSSDKGLVFSIYKEYTTLNSKKANNPTRKWVQDMNRRGYVLPKMGFR